MRQVKRQSIRHGLRAAHLLFFSWTLALSACNPLSITTAPVTAPPESGEPDEYAVYNALLKARFVHDGIKMIVIRESTSLGPASSFSERSGYLQENLPDLTDDMVDDFENKNQTAYELKPMFDLGVDYTLISDQELETLFGQQGQDGWAAFYERYPDSPGEITLSRVGFNASQNKALVYVGNQQHWLAGTGYFVMLTRQDVQWTIQGDIMAWIS